MMSDKLKMPTVDELAELSLTELNICIQRAFHQWREAFRMGQDSTEPKASFMLMIMSNSNGCNVSNDTLVTSRGIKQND